MGSSCCCCLVILLVVLVTLGGSLSSAQVWTFATGAWHSISNVFSATKQVGAEVKDLTRVKRSLGEDQDLSDDVANVVANVSDILDADLVANLTDAVAKSSSIEALGSVAAVGAVLFVILLYCVIKCIWKRWPITRTAESNQSSSPSVSEISESDIEAAAEQSRSFSPSAPEYDDGRHNEEVWFTSASEAPELTERQEPLNEQTMTDFEKEMISASKYGLQKACRKGCFSRQYHNHSYLKRVHPHKPQSWVPKKRVCQRREPEVQYAWMIDDDFVARLAARNEAPLICIKLSLFKYHVRALESNKAEIKKMIASSDKISFDKVHALREEAQTILEQLVLDMTAIDNHVARFGATKFEKAAIAELTAVVLNY
jgi:hypothetical protein